MFIFPFSLESFQFLFAVLQMFFGLPRVGVRFPADPLDEVLPASVLELLVPDLLDLVLILLAGLGPADDDGQDMSKILDLFMSFLPFAFPPDPEPVPDSASPN